jgi:hypothetical protein
VVSEVERYIDHRTGLCLQGGHDAPSAAPRANPRQARRCAVRRPGAEGLHDLVLGSGALPLEVLDEQVDAWIRRRVDGFQRQPVAR